MKFIEGQKVLYYDTTLHQGVEGTVKHVLKKQLILKDLSETIGSRKDGAIIFKSNVLTILEEK